MSKDEKERKVHTLKSLAVKITVLSILLILIAVLVNLGIVIGNAQSSIYDLNENYIIVKPQIISGDFHRLYKVEIPVTVCG